MKYADQLVDWLLEEGYTHCFFVAGGNIMHLLNAVRTKMTCVPFVNEVGAAIAAEYFTEANSGSHEKAFVLVTAGPGLTNTVTAIASAWTESRELLVIGGQVKSSDLANGEIRQRGIQEINGVEIVAPICKETLQISKPVSKDVFIRAIKSGSKPRKGPVFVEITLDAQGAPKTNPGYVEIEDEICPEIADGDFEIALEMLKRAERPILLLGGGVSRAKSKSLNRELASLGVPIMLTWNGADRFSASEDMNFGRPNTWGQRYSNILIQQSDLVIAVGTRLGIQQTGFAWDEFVPIGKLIQVDIDIAELKKGHPAVDLAVNSDADAFLQRLLEVDLSENSWADWVEFCRMVRDLLPVIEPGNVTHGGYVDPFAFMASITKFTSNDDLLIPCSSGGAFTVAMQALRNKLGQKIITNKGMASMGYGLSGAIGASIANPKFQTVLFEGDGGFAQNLQELGTVAANNLNIKMFIFSNRGYASIRMTQRNYFDGAWIGCDEDTGLGLPNLERLAGTYNIAYLKLSTDRKSQSSELSQLFDSQGPTLIEVPIDPEQTYFPKITSRVLADGSMKSNPLHLMDPPLPKELSDKVFKYLSSNNGGSYE